MKLRPHILPLLSLAGILVTACRQDPGFAPLSPADSSAIVNENLAYRAARDEFFRDDPSSPFRRDTAATFTATRWFPVNPRFRGSSVLHLYDSPRTVDILGTGGETRKQTRYGYFQFPVPDSTGKAVMIRLNVYKQAGSPSPHAGRLLIVWFTDMTTGNETYGVGRYLDIEDEQPDRDHLYVIDLNMAYNPYCAYSEVYSCAIPTEEDHVPVHIRAGELPFHEMGF